MTKRIQFFGGNCVAICVSYCSSDFYYLWTIQFCRQSLRSGYSNQRLSIAVFETGYIENTPSRANMTNVVPEFVSELKHRSLGGKKETYYTI
jgi:hypothetical protein